MSDSEKLVLLKKKVEEFAKKWYEASQLYRQAQVCKIYTKFVYMEMELTYFDAYQASVEFLNGSLTILELVTILIGLDFIIPIIQIKPFVQCPKTVTLVAAVAEKYRKNFLKSQE